MGVILYGKDKKQGQLDMKKWFMNVKASDMMSLDRSLPDTRREECLDIKYDLENLPQKLLQEVVQFRYIVGVVISWKPIPSCAQCLRKSSRHLINFSDDSFLKSL
ncbi:hypothetical protein OSTOST_16563 [Ostertagia ostertagi]